MLSLQYEKVKKILNTSCIAKVHQIHSNQVKIVTKENYTKEEEYDGMLTNEKGIALAIKVADCQGIFLYDAKREVIGAIHSGWKGTLGRIVINAIELMEKEYGSKVEDIEVYFCPSLCQDCFKVHEDVYTLFQDAFKDIDVNKYIDYSFEEKIWMIDTLGININLLQNKGILIKNIHESEMCTKCLSLSFHSYRKEDKDAGRNLAVLTL